MKTLSFGGSAWREYLRDRMRGSAGGTELDRRVARIVEGVRREGDAALVRFTSRFDGVRLRPGRLRVPAAEVRALARRTPAGLRAALREMAQRIEAFHSRQREGGFRMRLESGTVLEEVVRPLPSVGLYVPGGSGAYPSSVLMNAIPAQVAGVPRIIIATPPRTLESNPVVAAAIRIVGLEDSVYRVGGAQAIAALAYGTRSIPAVAKIVGPGNAYVAAAKRQVRDVVEVDQDAGPSEIVVVADDAADAAWIAADLLAQAEHGSSGETVVLVTPSRSLASLVVDLVRDGLRSIANRDAAARALLERGACVIVRDLEEAVEAVNALAPEHVELIVRGAEALARRVIAGAVFVGPYAPVAVGDYGIGPNHVLPTGGSARRSSPLSVRDFVRRQSVIRMTRAGLTRVAASMVSVAQAEGFPAHAQSLTMRLSRGRS